MSRGEIVIDPGAFATLDVTITHPDATEAVAYDAPAGGTLVTWPDTITATTHYYFDEDAFGPYIVSALDGTREVAGASGATIPTAVGKGAPTTLGIFADPVESLQASAYTLPDTLPVVPLTTPVTQDVIDALVALGLVTQSD